MRALCFAISSVVALAFHAQTHAGASLNIIISRPERAATVHGNSTLRVEGHLRGGYGERHLWVNDQSVVVDPFGGFYYDILPVHGLNQVEVYALDALGRVAYYGSSFYQSDAWLPFDAKRNSTELLHESTHAEMGAPLFERAVDALKKELDLGKLVQQGLSAVNMTTLKEAPAFVKKGYFAKDSSSYNIRGFLRALNFLNPEAKGVLEMGRVGFSGEFANKAGLGGLFAMIDAEVDLLLFNKLTCPIAAFTTLVECDQINVDFNISVSKAIGEAMSLEVHNVTIDASDPTISVVTPQMSVSPFFQPWHAMFPTSFSGWMSWIANQVANDHKSEIVDSASQNLEDELQKQLNGFLSGLNQTLSLDESLKTNLVAWAKSFPTLTIHTELDTLNIESGKVLASFATRTSTNQNVGHQPKDIILRKDCNGHKRDLAHEGPNDTLNTSLNIDFLNQIFHVLWWGGLFDTQVQLDFKGLPNLTIRTHPLMPPILDDCNASDTLMARVGDVELLLSFDYLGQQIKAVAYASAQAQAEISSDDNLITLTILSLDITSFDVAKVTGPLGEDTWLIELLFDSYVIPLLEEKYKTLELFSFEIPSLPLHPMFHWLSSDDELNFYNVTTLHQPGTIRANAYVD